MAHFAMAYHEIWIIGGADAAWHHSIGVIAPYNGILGRLQWRLPSSSPFVVAPPYMRVHPFVC